MAEVLLQEMQPIYIPEILKIVTGTFAMRANHPLTVATLNEAIHVAISGDMPIIVIHPYINQLNIPINPQPTNVRAGTLKTIPKATVVKKLNTNSIAIKHSTSHLNFRRQC